MITIRRDFSLLGNPKNCSNNIFWQIYKTTVNYLVIINLSVTAYKPLIGYVMVTYHHSYIYKYKIMYLNESLTLKTTCLDCHAHNNTERLGGVMNSDVVGK